jgi:hypothetical protein
VKHTSGETSAVQKRRYVVIVIASCIERSRHEVKQESEMAQYNSRGFGEPGQATRVMSRPLLRRVPVGQVMLALHVVWYVYNHCMTCKRSSMFTPAMRDEAAELLA